MSISQVLLNSIALFINENYIGKQAIETRYFSEPEFDFSTKNMYRQNESEHLSYKSEIDFEQNNDSPQYMMPPLQKSAQASASKKRVSPIKRLLSNLFTEIDDTFSARLIKLIDMKGAKDTDIYKRANIDRKLFSKIKNNKEYKPSKITAILFCFALELTLDETEDLLLTCGYALSHSSKFDLIIEYFIKNKIYNIYEVNEALFEFEQDTLF